MPWLDYVSYFVGGLSGANSIPHLVSGMMGRPFQSPFAKPPGKGLSSSTVNVLWGAFNLAVAYGLTLHVGAFDLRNPWEAGAVAAGGLVIALHSARHFGQFHGGNSTAG
ncbi:MAG TPA: hypothetical protein VMA54_22800 [Steroidobacteraceae bacterium]|nr:hypothetical protein [Steroidobacteraceae bacterium]